MRPGRPFTHILAQMAVKLIIKGHATSQSCHEQVFWNNYSVKSAAQSKNTNDYPYLFIMAYVKLKFLAPKQVPLNLNDVADRIRDLKGQQSVIKDKLDVLKLQPAIPLHLFKDEALKKFQEPIKEMFLGEYRAATKSYLRLFIEKIVITLPHRYKLQNRCPTGGPGK